MRLNATKNSRFIEASVKITKQQFSVIPHMCIFGISDSSIHECTRKNKFDKICANNFLTNRIN